MFCRLLIGRGSARRRWGRVGLDRGGVVLRGRRIGWRQEVHLVLKVAVRL